MKKNLVQLVSNPHFSRHTSKTRKLGFVLSKASSTQSMTIWFCYCTIFLILEHFPIGNTALHYAKPYPDQTVAQFLLNHGAKIDINHQKNININPRTLEQYFYDYCIIPEGDDIDDEDFKIRIKFKLFEKPVYGGSWFWFISKIWLVVNQGTRYPEYRIGSIL